MVLKRKISIILTMLVCLVTLFVLTSCDNAKSVDSLNEEELIIYNAVKECSDSDYQPYILGCVRIKYNNSNDYNNGEGGSTLIKLTCTCPFNRYDGTYGYRVPYWYLLEWSNDTGTSLDWPPTVQRDQEDSHYERYEQLNGDIEKINNALKDYYKDRGWD